MSASLDFCIKRTAEPEFAKFADRDFSLAEESDACHWFLTMFGVNNADTYTALWLDENGNKNEYTYSVRFDAEGDFDYVVATSSYNDGTLALLINDIADVIGRVAHGATYYAPKGRPQNGSRIIYTVGNVITLQEYAGCSFMRNTVMLPVKYEIERGDNA